MSSQIDEAPPIVYEVLRSSGQPLDASILSLMESHFGTDLSQVRIHSDPVADESTQAVNALAYAVGNHIAVRPSHADPQSAHGQLLLAHELAHVVQQRGSTVSPIADANVQVSTDPQLERAADEAATSFVLQNQPKKCISSSATGAALQRFETKEAGQISNLQSVIDTARQIADDTGDTGLMRWGRFTAGTGGVGVIEAATSPDSGSMKALAHRYLFTCRCGLIDMRHFYQLMYLSLLPLQGGNEGATQAGRKHEINSEATSQFAAEDTPSNALGALFGEDRSMIQSQDTFVAELQEFLIQCAPVDFSLLSGSDQQVIVDFYGSRNADGTPKNSNEAATPAILPIAACHPAGLRGPPDRSFPFAPDPHDPHGKTIKKRK